MSIKNKPVPPISEGEHVTGELAEYLMPYKWAHGPDDYVEVCMKNPHADEDGQERMWCKINLRTLTHMMSCFDFNTKFSRGGYIHLEGPVLKRDLAVVTKEVDNET